MSKLVRNERVKLFATFMNNIALAVVVAGSFAPAFVNRLQLGFIKGGVRWLRLSEQNFRVDKWSLCRVRPPRGKAAS